LRFFFESDPDYKKALLFSRARVSTPGVTMWLRYFTFCWEIYAFCGGTQYYAAPKNFVCILEHSSTV
jgi:hypothetical protein